MVITYQRIEIRSYTFHHRVHHEQGINYWVYIFFTCTSSLHTKAKFVKKINCVQLLQRDVNKHS